jgi:hypothetical protein
MPVKPRVLLMFPIRIYVIGSNITSSGFSLDAEGVALVVLPTYTVTFDSNPACGAGICSTSGLNQLWVEGSYDADSLSGGVRLSDSRRSQVQDFQNP